jgi:outer membrane phospholipase A
LRQALEDRFAKDGEINTAGELIRAMEEIELDLLNSGFTNLTLQKMMDVQHQLLKLENATFMQGQDTKRKSQTNTTEVNQTKKSQLSTAKEYFNTTEILNRQALPLQNHLKKKIQEYFKSTND